HSHAAHSAHAGGAPAAAQTASGPAQGATGSRIDVGVGSTAFPELGKILGSPTVVKRRTGPVGVRWVVSEAEGARDAVLSLSRIGTKRVVLVSGVRRDRIIQVATLALGEVLTSHDCLVKRVHRPWPHGLKLLVRQVDCVVEGERV